MTQWLALKLMANLGPVVFLLAIVLPLATASFVEAASGTLQGRGADSDEMSLIQRSLGVRNRPWQAAKAGSAGPTSWLAPTRGTRQIPSVVINLDLPPEERWVEFYTANRAMLQARIDKDDEPDWNMSLVSQVDFSGDQELLGEFRGIVKAMNDSRVTLEKLLYLEMSYERGITLGCTAILAATPNGTVFHGRNLDLARGNDLDDHIFDVTYERGGKPLIIATQFYWEIGMHTAYRIGNYSVAQNTRHGCDDPHKNGASARQGGHVFTMLLRRVLQNVDNFEDAVHTLAATPLIAPMYFSVAGVGPYEGAIITRDRTGYVAPFPNVLMLNPQIDRWFLVQTNDDTWIPPDDPRRPVAVQKLATKTSSMVDDAFMLDAMTTLPVLNPGTVFTWVLEPSTGQRMMLLGKDEIQSKIPEMMFAWGKLPWD